MIPKIFRDFALSYGKKNDTNKRNVHMKIMDKLCPFISSPKCFSVANSVEKERRHSCPQNFHFVIMDSFCLKIVKCTIFQ